MNRLPLFLVVGLQLWSAAAFGAADLEPSLAAGLWTGQAGPDSLAFAFPDGSGSDQVLIHILRDGKKNGEMPTTGLVCQGGTFSFTTLTGVRFEGEVDLGEGTGQARLLFGDNPPIPLLLVRRAPAQIRGLAARAPGDALLSLPGDSQDGWRTASPLEVGVDPAAVEAAVTAIAAGQAGVLHSFLVSRGGRLCVEEYFHGWGKAERHRLASVTKSVSALLVGAAVDAGEIPSVQSTLLELLPDRSGQLAGPKAGLQLVHILTMSMGLAWTDQEAAQTHGTGDRFFAEILGRPLAHAPGEVWHYVSADVDLLSGILRRATGLNAEELARRRLFLPLGIEDWDWSYGAVGEDRLMDGSLHLRPRDMLKFGQLVLDQGRWGDHQVLSREWVTAATASQIQTTGPEAYGYLWWLMELPGRDGPVPCLVASGWGSQFIAVFPELDLVVATTGGNEDNGKHFAVAGVLAKALLPGVGPPPSH